LAARLRAPRLARRSGLTVNMAMPILQPDQIYQLLRNLTSPVVAITSERGGKRNGMIADSAVRASIVPTIPRVSVYIHKFNYSHDLIFETGRFVLHLLRDDQFELIHRLGFESGRTRDKLAGLPHRLGALGVPVLDDCYAHFECRVANVMDTGSSTCFLGDVVDVGHGAARSAVGSVMTAAHFRANMPAEWRTEYEALLRAAQAYAAERSRDIRPVVWKGATGNA
jgi:flavin reductase (DIM6/NTAB) family NADH-FMN oxidoreductase RutF